MKKRLILNQSKFIRISNDDDILIINDDDGDDDDDDDDILMINNDDVTEGTPQDVDITLEEPIEYYPGYSNEDVRKWKQKLSDKLSRFDHTYNFGRRSHLVDIIKQEDENIKIRLIRDDESGVVMAVVVPMVISPMYKNYIKRKFEEEAIKNSHSDTLTDEQIAQIEQNVQAVSGVVVRAPFTKGNRPALKNVVQEWMSIFPQQMGGPEFIDKIPENLTGYRDKEVANTQRWWSNALSAVGEKYFTHPDVLPSVDYQKSPMSVEHARDIDEKLLKCMMIWRSKSYEKEEENLRSLCYDIHSYLSDLLKYTIRKRLDVNYLNENDVFDLYAEEIDSFISYLIAKIIGQTIVAFKDDTGGRISPYAYASGHIQNKAIGLIANAKYQRSMEAIGSSSDDDENQRNTIENIKEATTEKEVVAIASASRNNAFIDMNDRMLEYCIRTTEEIPDEYDHEDEDALHQFYKDKATMLKSNISSIFKNKIISGEYNPPSLSVENKYLLNLLKNLDFNDINIINEKTCIECGEPKIERFDANYQFKCQACGEISTAASIWLNKSSILMLIPIFIKDLTAALAQGKKGKHTDVLINAIKLIPVGINLRSGVQLMSQEQVEHAESKTKSPRFSFVLIPSEEYPSGRWFPTNKNRTGLPAFTAGIFPEDLVSSVNHFSSLAPGYGEHRFEATRTLVNEPTEWIWRQFGRIIHNAALMNKYDVQDIEEIPNFDNIEELLNDSNIKRNTTNIKKIKNTTINNIYNYIYKEIKQILFSLPQWMYETEGYRISDAGDNRWPPQTIDDINNTKIISKNNQPSTIEKVFPMLISNIVETVKRMTFSTSYPADVEEDDINDSIILIINSMIKSINTYSQIFHAKSDVKDEELMDFDDVDKIVEKEIRNMYRKISSKIKDGSIDNAYLKKMIERIDALYTPVLHESKDISYNLDTIKKYIMEEVVLASSGLSGIPSSKYYKEKQRSLKILGRVDELERNEIDANSIAKRWGLNIETVTDLIDSTSDQIFHMYTKELLPMSKNPIAPTMDMLRFFIPTPIVMEFINYYKKVVEEKYDNVTLEDDMMISIVKFITSTVNGIYSAIQNIEKEGVSIESSDAIDKIMMEENVSSIRNYYSFVEDEVFREIIKEVINGFGPTLRAYLYTNRSIEYNDDKYRSAIELIQRHASKFKRVIHRYGI